MIYEFPREDEPIRQGDIFAHIPRTEISLGSLALVRDTGTEEAQWSDIVNEPDQLTVILPVRPVYAIVASQDCDNVRSPDITLCEIKPFADVEGKAKDASKTKAWVSIITQQARTNLKWFYLPPDDNVGFTGKMAVEFAVTIRVPRLGLEALRKFRRGRLNPVADEHFRERLAEFFRRYPYDEWYALNETELEYYRSQYSEAEPYPWQKPDQSTESQ
ncbi:hypothetical protein [Rubinisphaera italica]|uniref:Uncharacterized protein n=1 Tax=Rubinisphaera italica TaxID=2527969 RepID=A0A5C5XJ04_9PLAN|nr:hypothetical protein [Rubinisphaera italica]TWT63000.1 hypothetical protein Pan54_37510 [Rubinisphaera italica]